MICKQCGKEFTKVHPNEKYCSDKCRKAYLRAYYQVYNANGNHRHGALLVSGKCLICGKEIYGRTNKKYCSNQCAQIAFWQNKHERMLKQQ